MKALVCAAAVFSTILAPSAQAVSIGLVKVHAKASYVEDSNGLFQPLDLKTKRLTFTPGDISKCGHNLQRRIKTLSYNCTIPIPSNAKVSKLQKMITNNEVKVRFGRTEKDVKVAVARDGKSIKFSADFDITGLDFEVARFNDDFFSIYSKSAQLVIKEAMTKRAVTINVYESRNN